MMKYILVTVILIAAISFYSISKSEVPDIAQEIVDKAIIAHGGDNYKDLDIAFTFRQKDYEIHLMNGHYTYVRITKDSTGYIRDHLTNNGFKRLINEQPTKLSSKDQKRFSNSVNSVAYFILLPKGLNDPAVIKKYLGLQDINGQSYHHLEIKFTKEGGGKDFEDVFNYWIHNERFTVDYLAYSYLTDGGGVRFRRAINPRTEAGIRFQDYINYKPEQKSTPLEDLPTLFERNSLIEISRIINENIRELDLKDKAL